MSFLNTIPGSWQALCHHLFLVHTENRVWHLVSNLMVKEMERFQASVEHGVMTEMDKRLKEEEEEKERKQN